MQKIVAWILVAIGCLLGGFVVALVKPQPFWVGAKVNGAVLVPSAQLVKSSGGEFNIGERPVDMVVRESDDAVFVRTLNSVLQLDPTTGKVVNKVTSADSASLHGLCLTPDGQKLLVSNSADTVYCFDVRDGIKPAGKVKFAAAGAGGVAYPCGICVRGDHAFVCLSRSNLVAEIDLGTTTVVKTMPTAPAPYDVAASGDSLIVTCWGRQPGKLSAATSGTPIDIDDRGIATGGTVCFFKGDVRKDLTIGHQPSQIVVHGPTAYIAVPGDDEVCAYNVAEEKLVDHLRLQPDRLRGFGVAPNALALARNGSTLYAACGGLNAVAVINLDGHMHAEGYLAADWYPIGVGVTASKVWAINAKGIGSRGNETDKRAVYDFTGTACAYDLPLRDLKGQTELAIRQADKALPETALPKGHPLASPSPIKHVFYIIKENRTYDQVFGDIPRGNGEPKFVNFGERITPNMHALAKQFVLLDNFYCNGVNSADGHSWATEGNASSYFERSFGGFTRSYPFVMDDPLAPNPGGFIWNNMLRHGYSFLNYGESDYAGTSKKFAENLADLKNGVETVFTQNIPDSDLRRHSQRDYPGWNLEIPDQLRAARFVRDFQKRDAAGTVPNLSIIYLPEDHTGASVSGETCVADNDYAVGLVVEAITHSKAWASSLIVCVEDDAQAGIDHVDGHRSPCLMVSPYIVHGQVVSSFSSQVSVLKTIEQIFGLPPINRMDAIAPLMADAFTSKPDFAPFSAISPKVAMAKAPGFWRNYALDLSKPDHVDPRLMTELIWRETRPHDKMPSILAGTLDRDDD